MVRALRQAMRGFPGSPLKSLESSAGKGQPPTGTRIWNDMIR